MIPDSDPLIRVTERGLYCPPGDFYIDPWRPVQTAVITHGHGDHLRPGSARYILARPGERIARIRLCGNPGITPVDYGVHIRIGAATVSLHAAGHILGSAQVRIEHAGQVWVVSGDYKRQHDPTCTAFEPLECDVFVSEATFALPIYQWPETCGVVQEIAHWWSSNREQGLASVLFCYALGKAQRVLAELRAFTNEAVYLHGSMGSLVGVYRDAGVEMLPTQSVNSEGAKDFRGALILAPPSAASSNWVRRFGAQTTGFCSGWMQVQGEQRRRGYDRGFVLSDHADWSALVRTCAETRARRVLLTHGHTEELTRYLNEQGTPAEALTTAYGGES